MTVSWQSVTVVVVVVVLFGGLAVLKVPGAAIAAIAAGGALVTWVTQGPTKRSTGLSMFPPPVSYTSPPPLIVDSHDQPLNQKGPLDPL